MADHAVTLKVQEALQEEAYKGIVRIDSQTMRSIQVKAGDIVEIEGNRKTVGIVDRAYPSDIGQNIIRMDGIIRRNARTGIGENITVRKADVREAKTIIIAPGQQGEQRIMIQGGNPEIFFKERLIGRAVVKGDIITLGGTNRRRKTMMGSPFENIFDIFEDFPVGNFGFGTLRFIVADVNPKMPVVITENTQVKLSNKPVEVKEAEDKVPEVTYEDIGGLDEEVKKIREMVELPLRNPEVFENLGIAPPKGVLLHGPPGTGKTLLAKAVANETNANFILVNGPELLSKFYGETEKKIRNLFEEAEKNAPTIIFVDEIDAIAPKREETYGEVERRMVSQLLTMMDGLKSRGKVIVIGATNRPNSLDPALRRPGRFDREIDIGAPKKDGRLKILKIHTRNMPIEHWDEETAVAFLEKRIKGYTKKSKSVTEKDGQRLGTIDKEITSFKKTLSAQEKEKKDLQVAIHKSEEELKKMRQQSRGKTGETLSRTVPLMRHRELEIVEFKKELEKLEKENREILQRLDMLEREKEELDGEMHQTEEGAIFVKELQELLKKDKTLLHKIARALREVNTRRMDGLLTDIKKLEKLKNGSSDIIELIKKAETSKVIDEKFYDDVKLTSTNKLLEEHATHTHGFVGADLEALCKEAAMNVIRRKMPSLSSKTEKIPQIEMRRLRVLGVDFMAALRVVRPSSLREVLVEAPEVKWNDIGGLDKLKQEVREAVEWPLKYPDRFTRMGIKPPRGILMYGPPGTGKTLLAKAAANESEANFILVKGPELLSKWVGESEKGVRKVFERARQTAPTIVFFDEIDALATRRGLDNGSQATERVVNALLAEMDGLEELTDVVVLAATNRPDLVDPALLRPGRFDRVIATQLPDAPARKEILKIHTHGMPLADDVDLDEINKKLEDFNGADIQGLCREAAMVALRRDQKSRLITFDDFNKALEKTLPSLRQEDIKKYKSIEEKYLRAARVAQQQSVRQSYMG